MWIGVHFSADVMKGGRGRAGATLATCHWLARRLLSFGPPDARACTHTQTGDGPIQHDHHHAPAHRQSRRCVLFSLIHGCGCGCCCCCCCSCVGMMDRCMDSSGWVELAIVPPFLRLNRRKCPMVGILIRSSQSTTWPDGSARLVRHSPPTRLLRTTHKQAWTTTCCGRRTRS